MGLMESSIRNSASILSVRLEGICRPRLATPDAESLRLAFDRRLVGKKAALTDLGDFPTLFVENYLDTCTSGADSDLATSGPERRAVRLIMQRPSFLVL
jgi:hypothetical protein